VGAYQISGGASGGTLLEGVSYLLTTLSIFFSSLDAVSAASGSVVPLFGTVDRLLTAIKFFHDIITTGTACSGGAFGAVAMVMLFTAISTLAVIDIVSKFNIILGLVTGLLIDRASSWLISQAENCK
jgi:hypothetical protein